MQEVFDELNKLYLQLKSNLPHMEKAKNNDLPGVFFRHAQALKKKAFNCAQLLDAYKKEEQ